MAVTRRRPLRAAVLLLGMAGGCVGQIGEAGTPTQTDAPVPNTDGGTSTPPAPTPPADCTRPSVGEAAMRRLTRAEYNNTVRDLLGDRTAPANQFPEDDDVAGTGAVSPLLAESYMSAATALATAAAPNLATLGGCTAGTADEACARQFIERFGRRAFRRPVARDEADALFGIYTTIRPLATHATALQTVLRAMLQSPNFLYRPEFGVDDGGAVGAAVVRLTAHETASRLSYLLWNTMPDAALFAAADAGELATPEQVATQAQRLLAHPNARVALGQFYSQWLGLDEVPSLERDPTAYPQFNRPMAEAMAAETRAFALDVMFEGDGRLETLLTAPVGFVNATLAPVYGMTGVTGTALQRVNLDPAQRAGILTQASVLTVTADGDQSSPVLRGKWVRERLLCTPLPDPPADLMIVPPEPDPNATTRERFRVHSENAACAGCHRLMEPLGIGFEHYDAIGRYRATEGRLPVDASGELTGTREADGTFRGVPELARRLARSSDVRACAASQWFRFAFGRPEAAADQCSVRTMNQAFAASDYNLRELVLAVTRTQAFVHTRRAVASEGSR